MNEFVCVCGSVVNHLQGDGFLLIRQLTFATIRIVGLRASGLFLAPLPLDLPNEILSSLLMLSGLLLQRRRECVFGVDLLLHVGYHYSSVLYASGILPSILALYQVPPLSLPNPRTTPPSRSFASSSRSSSFSSTRPRP